ncbi:sensor histidine kinase [Dactylosporangium sp. NPDC050588]|uniref:sensor histidine kinase n=1 Tax=Dactylosporangium sp. NPDC050588 TaxID=3157211 RepID=UPI0033F24055
MTTELRPPLRHRLRPWHWLVVDVVAALLYAVPAGGIIAVKAEPGWLAVAALAVSCGVLPLARRFPLTASLAALAVFWLSPLSSRLGWMALVPAAYALYRVAERHRGRTAVVALVAGLTGPVATALPGFRHVGGVLPFALLLVAAWLVGYLVHQHRRYTEELLRHRARQADAELERAARRSADERLRIARELHDVVAHSMSVITVQATYGRLTLDREPAKAADALAAIETTGRESLAELRRVLAALRDQQPAATAPAPGLPDLPRLAAQTEAAGVRVDLAVTGDPRPLGAGLELTVYRIVQEALTNVIRHAAATRARVSVAYTDAEVTVEVTDDGRGADEVPDPAADGHGLSGMRERAALFGGTLSTAPAPSGGFRVRAVLPIPSAAVPDAAACAGPGVAAGAGPGAAAGAGPGVAASVAASAGPGVAASAGLGVATGVAASAGLGVAAGVATGAAASAGPSVAAGVATEMAAGIAADAAARAVPGAAAGTLTDTAAR